MGCSSLTKLCNLNKNFELFASLTEKRKENFAKNWAFLEDFSSSTGLKCVKTLHIFIFEIEKRFDILYLSSDK